MPEAPTTPCLLVRAPDTRATERRYVLDLVLKEWLGLDYCLEPSDETRTSIRLVGDGSGSELTLADILLATPDDDWLTTRSMPVLPLAHAALDAGPAVPVLYGDRGPGGQAAEATDNGLHLLIDVFGGVFFCVTRYEEVVRRERDAHERFPAVASIAAREDFLGRPLVDEYVDLLWKAMARLWPELTRKASTFRVQLTHDVDHPWATLGKSLVTVTRSAGADVIKRRDPGLAARRAASYIASFAGRVELDPYNTFDFLMNTSERYGLQSSFYFIAGHAAGAPRSAWYAGDIDGTYRLDDPPVVRLMQRIHGRGHRIGLHAGYGTFLSPEGTRQQFESLRDGCRRAGIDQGSWGVRQHYLRFSAPETWRNHAAAGLDYDSTLGFADREGFRASTCREFPIFDLLAGRALTLRERPLLVMDTTLFDDPSVGLDEAASRTLAIAAACRRHNGDAVLLIHNSSLAEARRQAFYADLVAALTSLPAA